MAHLRHVISQVVFERIAHEHQTYTRQMFVTVPAAFPG
jgi:hypothetical protein